MAINIVKPELEAKMALLGASDGVPTSKRAVSIAILEAAVEAARKRRVSINRIIIELRAPRPSKRAKTRVGKRSTEPKPSAT